MAGAVAKVGVVVSANTRRFDRGMKRATHSSRQFRSSVLETKNVLMKFGAALGGVAIVRGLQRMTVGTMKAVDATAKLADRLGATTEAIVGMHHAATLGGVEITMWNQAVTAMVKRLGEAQRGTGEAVVALEILGLRMKDLNGLTPEKQLQKIADAFRNLGMSEQTVLAADKMFSESGRKMVHVLLQGGDALRQAEQAAKSLGGTFSREFAASVEKVNDAVTSLKLAFEGFKIEGLKAILPDLQRFVSTSVGAMVLLKDMGTGASGKPRGGFFNWLANAARRRGAKVEARYQRLMKENRPSGIVAPTSLQADFLKGFADLVQGPTFLRDLGQKTLDQAGGTGIFAQKHMNPKGFHWKSLPGLTGKGSAAWGGMKGVFGQIGSGVVAWTGKIGEAFGRLRTQSKNLRKEWLGWGAEVRMMVETPMETFDREMSRLVQGYKQKDIGWTTFVRRWEQLTKERTGLDGATSRSSWMEIDPTKAAPGMGTRVAEVVDRRAHTLLSNIETAIKNQGAAGALTTE